MKLTELFEAVEADARLEGVDVRQGATPADDRIVVRDLRTGFVTVLGAEVCLELPWPTVRGFITGELDWAPLYHVSRIVGYFSRIENWNPSKLGELRDRRAGDYSIPGAGAN